MKRGKVGIILTSFSPHYNVRHVAQKLFPIFNKAFGKAEALKNWTKI